MVNRLSTIFSGFSKCSLLGRRANTHEFNRILLSRHNPLDLFAKRQCSSSPLRSRKYALLVGGGVPWSRNPFSWRKRTPELGRYQDINTIVQSLLKNKQTKGERLSVLFGGGEETQSCKTADSILQRFVNNYIEKLPVLEALPRIPFTKGPANLQSLEAEFCHLSKQMCEQDELWIVLTGHGISSGGVLLWRGELLTPSHLSTLINKLPGRVKIKVFVDSCYSGNYLQLTSDRISVFTASSSKSYSYSHMIKGSAHIQKIFENFIGKHSFLEGHLKGANDRRNLTASDSLSHFLDKSIYQCKDMTPLMTKIVQVAKTSLGISMMLGGGLAFLIYAPNPEMITQLQFFEEPYFIIPYLIFKSYVPSISLIGGMLLFNKLKSEMRSFLPIFFPRIDRQIKVVQKKGLDFKSYLFDNRKNNKIRELSMRRITEPVNFDDYPKEIKELWDFTLRAQQEGSDLESYRNLNEKLYHFLTSTKDKKEIESLVTIYRNLQNKKDGVEDPVNSLMVPKS